MTADALCQGQTSQDHTGALIKAPQIASHNSFTAIHPRDERSHAPFANRSGRSKEQQAAARSVQDQGPADA